MAGPSKAKSRSATSATAPKAGRSRWKASGTVAMAAKASTRGRSSLSCVLRRKAASAWKNVGTKRPSSLPAAACQAPESDESSAPPTGSCQICPKRRRTNTAATARPASIWRSTSMAGRSESVVGRSVTMWTSPYRRAGRRPGRHRTRRPCRGHRPSAPLRQKGTANAPENPLQRNGHRARSWRR